MILSFCFLSPLGPSSRSTPNSIPKLRSIVYYHFQLFFTFFLLIFTLAAPSKIRPPARLPLAAPCKIRACRIHHAKSPVKQGHRRVSYDSIHHAAPPMPRNPRRKNHAQPRRAPPTTPTHHTHATPPPCAAHTPQSGGARQAQPRRKPCASAPCAAHRRAEPDAPRNAATPPKPPRAMRILAAIQPQCAYFIIAPNRAFAPLFCNYILTYNCPKSRRNAAFFEL